MSLYSRKMLLSLVIVLAIPSSPVEQGNYRVGLTQLSSAEISLPNHDNTNTTDRNQLTTKSKFRHFLITFDVCVWMIFFFFFSVLYRWQSAFYTQHFSGPGLWRGRHCGDHVLWFTVVCSRPGSSRPCVLLYSELLPENIQVIRTSG